MPKHKTLSQLRASFGQTPGLSFHEGEGGLTCARIRTGDCTGEIYLHGSHITQWRPTGHDEVLWRSSRAVYRSGKAIRGGVPICFPWFAGRTPADHPDPSNAPSHGYARTTLWDVEDAAETDAGLAITLTTNIKPFSIRYTASFGKTLSLAMQVENTSDEATHFEQALHSYFTVGQIRQVAVTGMENDRYINTVGGVNDNVDPTGQAITFEEETDQIYRSAATCTITDPALSRKIVIEKTGSGSTVVWNPWMGKAKGMSDFGDDEWPGMLCVETANIGDEGIDLAPGKTHTLAATIHVQGLNA